MRYKASISYNGSKFYGFQRLKNHPSVQEELERVVLPRTVRFPAPPEEPSSHQEVHRQPASFRAAGVPAVLLQRERPVVLTG